MKKGIVSLSMLVGIVSLLAAAYLLWEQITPQPLDFVGRLPQQPPIHVHAVPILLSIPVLNLRVPIIASTITNGIWQTTTLGVSYLKTSPVPGEIGNSILYGHDFMNILGKLPESRPGERIFITYTDGTRKEFVIKYTSIVSPSQIDILHQTQDSRITLYTCTGFFDSQRFVAIAVPPPQSLN